MNRTLADRIRGRLDAFTRDLESGELIQQKYTCRNVESRLKPRQYDPDAVRQTRDLLIASQSEPKCFRRFPRDLGEDSSGVGTGH
jgi:hypothetical protein